jgi:hypothetical protein
VQDDTGVSNAENSTFAARCDSRDMANSPRSPLEMVPSRKFHATGHASHFSEDDDSGAATAIAVTMEHKSAKIDFIIFTLESYR